MHFQLDSDQEFSSFTAFPRGYPLGHPVEGSSQVPKLFSVHLEEVPQRLVAFNDRARVHEPKKVGLHFYKYDKTFDSFVKDPLTWVSRLMGFGVVLTPDLSIGDDMPSWLRQSRTCQSRAVGVILQSRGFTVVPSLRWRAMEDLHFVTAGIDRESTIALSNYGARRSSEERFLFRIGVEQILQELKPKTVLLYGSLDSDLRSVFESTRVIEYPSPMSQIRRCAKSKKIEQTSLF